MPVLPKPPSLAGGSRLRSAAGVRSDTRHRWPKPPEETGPARAGASTSGATLTAHQTSGGQQSPHPYPGARQRQIGYHSQPSCHLGGRRRRPAVGHTGTRPRGPPPASGLSLAPPECRGTLKPLWMTSLRRWTRSGSTRRWTSWHRPCTRSSRRPGRAPLGSSRGYCTTHRSSRVCRGSFQRPRACAA